MSIRMGRGIRTVVVLVALGCAAVLVFARSDAQGSGGGDCPKGNCVIIVEVDGLEPKDVTPSSTPVMWALAHPDIPGAENLQGGNRNGYMWQAARGVVQAGTAPAANSLLSGGYPQQTDVPSDEYITADNPPEHVWEGETGDSGFVPVGRAQSLLASGQTGTVSTAAYSGDPGLKAVLSQASDDGGKHVAYPGSPKNQAIKGDPQLCPIPRTPASLQASTNNCDADDAQVLQAAQSDFTGSGNVGFEYVHLAELGRIKQLHGDVDQQGQAQNPAVAEALKTTDAALATFVGQINQNDSAKWAKTTLFVVGNHGYETTPLAQRVPDTIPGAPANSDLSDYVLSKSSEGATLIPQGTLATVYRSSGPTLDVLRQDILDVNSDPKCTSSTAGKCISEVLYTNPVTDAQKDDSVAKKHPDWHAIPMNANGTPTGSGGDLLVVMAPGWAAGRATSAPDPTDAAASVTTPPEATNPYEASSGGPRNRAIAAFVNGPQGVVKSKPFNEDNGRAPVTQGPDAYSQPDPIGVSAANASPEDDANAVGHERQLETPDVALSAAALMGIAVDPDIGNAGGRLLDEAFTFPPQECVTDCGPTAADAPPEPPPEPPPPPPPPPPPVEPPPIQIEQPPPPEGFNFHGLIRNLKAQVTDDKGNPVSKAKPGADLSYIQLTADFGKPQAQVSLTFYRSATSRKGKSARRRNKLKAVVHFKPFKVQRGPAKIKLQVPARFAPDHVGVIVQEVREVKSPPKERMGGNGSSGEQTNFEGFGPKDGGIVAIADANKLHTKARATKGRKRGR
jgi:hypothetical protein